MELMSRDVFIAINIKKKQADSTGKLCAVSLILGVCDVQVTLHYRIRGVASH
jgi:hypothetical protein